MDWFGLGEEYFTADKLEFHGGASFLKGGLVYSKLLTTVSPGYADEICNSFYGERLEGLLNARRKDLFGILNGIDYEEYNPRKDLLLNQTYSKSSVNKKSENKTALQQELNLRVSEEIPMIGMITRLVDQKGLDLITCVLDEILNEEVQLVILGTGEERYENILRAESYLRPCKVSVNIRFDNSLAHKIYAASDLFLMPSLFEPCGLGQMISQRYGTLPIVRETGGLKDTVISYNEETKEGNGFSFTNYNAHDMLYTIKRALSLYHKKTIWNKLRKTAMSSDYSWQNSAIKYLELYLSLKPELEQEYSSIREISDQATGEAIVS
jgi:starch synthase